MISKDLEVAATYFAQHAEDGGVYLSASRCRHLAGLLEAHARDVRQFERHEVPQAAKTSETSQGVVQLSVERARREPHHFGGGDAA